jgi:hypothetical protein
MMRLALCLAVLLALTGSALATLGDNGLTTYDGRKRAPNTLVFGNQMVIDQAVESTLRFTGDVLKGTWKPVPNDAATEKQEVRPGPRACASSLKHSRSRSCASSLKDGVADSVADTAPCTCC